MERLERRSFLQRLAAFALGGCAALRTAGCRSHAPAQPDAGPNHDASGGSAFTTFTASTFVTLSALCERILPRDQDPGAIDLGVPTYIDRALASPELASVRELLLRVLPLLDRQASTRFAGKAFHEATAAQQDELLGLWEHGHDGGQHVFPVVLSLTLEGAFGDPKYGGNTGGRGFAMIGFRPDPPFHKMSAEMAMPGRP